MMLSTCKDEIVPDTPGVPGGGNGDKEIPVMIKMKDLLGSPASTYGTDYPGETPAGGSSWEDDIHDVTVYIFDNTFVCEKIIYMQSSSPVGPVMVKTGYKNFIAVINADSKITLPNTEATANYANISRMLTNASSSLPTSPFLMTGRRLNVPLPDELPDTAPYDISIGVERACAKVTLNVTKSGLAATHDINLTKITLHQGADQVALLEVPNPDPGTTNYNLTDSKSAFDPSTGEVPLKSPNTYCVLVDSFYTYESLCGTDKSKAVWIELESTVNSPSNIRTAKFYLGEYSPTLGDTLYDVKRNYWYDVYVDIVKPGLDSIYITVNACPWNVADTQIVYPGAGYQVYNMASPFKLVKNYTAYDISRQSNIAAIATHTKGASWLDFAVTNGDAWKLAFDGGAEENVGAIMSKDNGVTWQDTLLGIGDDLPHRVYIYRPYVENAEPKSGPTFSLNVGGKISAGDYSDGTRVRDFVVQPRDTTPIPTNSYILRPELSGTPVPPANKTHAYIPLKGVYRYWEDYLLANGDSISDGTITAELLWQDRSVGDVVKNISVINKDKRDSAYIYAEAGSVPGNAVVAMKVNNVIYWSFHLWVTEYNPYEAAGQKLFNGTTRNIFMDRNLGALSNEYDATGEARGLFYQFGRKDPFPRGTGWLGGNANFMWYKSASSLGSITPVTTLASMPSTSLRPLQAIPVTLNNPTTFYNVAPWPLSVENDSLWDTHGGNKSAFDPCPEGWRVPPQRGGGGGDSPWSPLINTNFALNALGYESGLYNSDIGYYPFSGSILNGSITDAGSGAYFWTSYAADANNARGLAINNTGAISKDPTTLNKNRAVSVRCVVDVKYLMTTKGGGLFGSNADGMIP
jgi:hypothetical protein